MSTHPSPSPAPLSLSITPYKITSAARHVDKQVTLTNNGASPVQVVASTSAITRSSGGCALAKAPQWITVSPAHFTLQPGQHKVAHVHVNAPGTAAGSYDLAAVFASTPQAGHGLSVSGAVGERVQLAYPGSTQGRPCVAARPPHLAVHQASSTGIPFAGIGGALLAVLVIIAAVLTWRHRRAGRA